MFDYLKDLKILFPSKNRDINRLNLGMIIRFASLSSINSSNVMLECELIPLSSGFWICGEALRFHHVNVKSQIIVIKLS